LVNFKGCHRRHRPLYMAHLRGTDLTCRSTWDTGVSSFQLIRRPSQSWRKSY
jgi:hypothetical protein